MKNNNKNVAFRWIVSMMLGIVLTAAIRIEAYAAPKQMWDGNIFDPEFYAATYPDVTTVFGSDENLLYQHYLICGIGEGRLPYLLSEEEIRDQEIYNKIMALQTIYPQGMPWNKTNTYIQPTEENRENGWAGLVRTACQAFAYMVQDAVFGSNVKINWYQTGLREWCMAYAGGTIISQGDGSGWIPRGYEGQDPVINAKFEEYWSNIRVGDAIADLNHIMIVLTKAEDHVTVVEGNLNGMVNWGRMLTKEQLRLTLETIETPSW